MFFKNSNLIVFIKIGLNPIVYIMKSDLGKLTIPKMYF